MKGGEVMDFSELYNNMLSAEHYRVLIVPFVLMALDFLTGVSHAWATGHLKSYKMREGLNRKFAEICIIAIGVLFRWAINLPDYIVIGLTIYVVIMELVSISENLDKMGVPLPKWVQKALRNAEYKIQNENLNPNEKKDGETDD
jgi:toxin secretion/phage lysis holin